MSAPWTWHLMPEEEDQRSDALGDLFVNYGLADELALNELREKATQLVPGRGTVAPLIVIVGEAPGEDEDREGRPFVGRAGRLLSEVLAEVGLDEAVDLWITNVVKYRPVDGQGRNRTPRIREVAASMDFLDAELNILDPLLVVPLGSTALKALLPAGPSITDARGKARPVETASQRTWLLPTWHPSAVLRDHTGRKRSEMLADLCAAAELVEPGRSA